MGFGVEQDLEKDEQRVKTEKKELGYLQRNQLEHIPNDMRKNENTAVTIIEVNHVKEGAVNIGHENPADIFRDK